ncbi:DUF4288 domain-containing protein [Chitinophaga sp. Cy-1792]|uniref:DUF4288 domain-containing protein n=1 Tax=Chitinophaga sp. Cy-1792 TaxID=2608339 RepID=UPI00141E7E15|nr:DUF4288 domain-containing protein [Chitinophaga sp. Cy-1792]NIG53480.1 DUF4288 domain-containing protein [Chitinophaga sp. Cy-1792]
MHWFVAKVVYQIISGNGNHTPQFDEQIRLISAVTKKDALEKAHQIGIQEQYAFKNLQEELVQWKFINVPEVYDINQLTDGMEVYSRIEEPGDPKSYLAWLQTKSAQLQDQPLVEIH